MREASGLKVRKIFGMLVEILLAALVLYQRMLPPQTPPSCTSPFHFSLSKYVVCNYCDCNTIQCYHNLASHVTLAVPSLTSEGWGRVCQDAVSNRCRSYNGF